MAKSHLPKHIQVGPHRYRVVRDSATMDRLSREQRCDLLGHCDRRHLTIYIDPDQAEDMAADTLLHETLHAATAAAGLADEWDTEREEAAVNRLTPVLLDVLRSNPKLLRALGATQ